MTEEQKEIFFEDLERIGEIIMSMDMNISAAYKRYESDKQDAENNARAMLFSYIEEEMDMADMAEMEIIVDKYR